MTEMDRLALWHPPVKSSLARGASTLLQIVNFDKGNSGPIVVPAAGIDRRRTDSADGDGLCSCASGDGEAAGRDIVARFRIQSGQDVLQPSRERNIQAKDLAIIGSATAESSPVAAAVAFPARDQPAVAGHPCR